MSVSSRETQSKTRLRSALKKKDWNAYAEEGIAPFFIAIYWLEYGGVVFTEKKFLKAEYDIC